MAEKSQYELLGIDPHKAGARKAFKEVVQNDFRHAFVNIVTDPSDRRFVVTKHSDGSGSKSVQRVLHYLINNDPYIFQSDPDDFLSMNFGDVAASGFLGSYFLTDTMAINGQNVPKDIILEQIAIGIQRLIRLYRQYGIDVHFLGGETADLPDQVSTYVVEADVFARTERKNVIAGNIQPGDAIYGFASDGRAVWEDCQNSGIMSNGLTQARYSLMHHQYTEQFPFLCRKGRSFSGRFYVNSAARDLLLRVSHAILSSTRQWAIVIKMLVDELKVRKAFHLLHGISMNTGGGATKVMNLGEGIWFRKTMPLPPRIFRLIQEEDHENWENMFVTFNCGIGLDIVGSPKGGVLTRVVRSVSRKSGVVVHRLGDCRKSKDGKNHVKLITPKGTFYYHKK